MPTRKFRELVESMPAGRQQGIARRVRESLASMPLEEIRKAKQMTQAKLAETLGRNQCEISKIEHRTDILHQHARGLCRGAGRQIRNPGNVPRWRNANLAIRGSAMTAGFIQYSSSTFRGPAGSLSRYFDWDLCRLKLTGSVQLLQVEEQMNLAVMMVNAGDSMRTAPKFLRPRRKLPLYLEAR
jgi:hypothetical protein